MRSIRSQLLGTLIPGALLLSTAAGIGLYAFVDETLERSLDAALAAKAEAIAGDVHVSADGSPHLELADVDYPHGNRREIPFYFQLWRADGSTVARFAPGTDPLPAPHRNRPFGDAALTDGMPVRVTLIKFSADADDGPSESTAGESNHLSGAPEQLTLIVAQDRRAEEGPLAVLLTGLLAAAAVMALGTVVIVTWSVKRGLRPVAVVSDLADRIGPDSLDVRFPGAEELPPELLPIGVKLNELVARLSTAFARERRFSAAVAHELRTPLAELRSACDVALKWPDDTAMATAALGDVRDIAVQMSTLVATLLSLARRQASADEPVRAVPISIRAAVDLAWRAFADLARERTLSFSTELDDVTILTDPDLLAAVLRNLFENAVRYAPHGTSVMARTAEASDGTCELHISNSCVGLTSDDLPRLFEPFWRGDAARTLGKDGGHAGLGLTLVQAYCVAMKVPIACELVTPDQLQITLHFSREISMAAPST